MSQVGELFFVIELTCTSPELTLTNISGPNGSGKTSVFRVLRDIWPTVCGRLAKPSLDIEELGSGNGIFFVPQRPYTCLGTLRDQIIYPLSKEEAEKRAAKLYTSGKSKIQFTSKSLFDFQIKRYVEKLLCYHKELK